MKVVYTKAITKDVRQIKNQKLISKIERTINNIKSASTPSDIKSLKKLSGNPYAYRIRIGNYRLGIYIESQTVTLMRFLKRGDIYKMFP